MPSDFSRGLCLLHLSWCQSSVSCNKLHESHLQLKLTRTLSRVATKCESLGWKVEQIKELRLGQMESGRKHTVLKIGAIDFEGSLFVHKLDGMTHLVWLIVQ